MVSGARLWAFGGDSGDGRVLKNTMVLDEEAEVELHEEADLLDSAGFGTLITGVSKDFVDRGGDGELRISIKA